MKVGIELGTTSAGEPAKLDLEELLSTRLLVQGNSGSGKSHLLRRLLEQSAPWVQQAIIDPEGDFVSFSERFGHTVVDAERSPGELQRIATRIRQHRASVVLNLEGLDAEEQMRCAAAFLNGLFDADRSVWFPMLIAVDEAQLFAPAVAGEVADDARKASLGAMTNLMCRGRKRGLAGIIATQRLAKLAKNVAAEASNFLMGRTFLDIDMARAADLLGMERRQAEAFRDLDPGQFVALGPALSRRPLGIRIGAVDTAGRSGRPSLMPLPETSRDALEDLIFDASAEVLPMPASSSSRSIATADLMRRIETSKAIDMAPEPEADPRSEAERQELLDGIYAELLSDPEAAFRPVPLLYQDFQFHCRLRKLGGFGQDMSAFRRRLALARAGISAESGDEAWQQVLSVSESLPEEMQGVFLLVARAAREQAVCPSDEALARAYGSHSPSRGRWLLTYMGEQGLIRCEADFRGNRTVSIAGVGWRTLPGSPKGGGKPAAAISKLASAQALMFGGRETGEPDEEPEAIPAE
ncbi:ATP-binding protein [Phreatobacter stygius]|uniref:ATP-binding protein n=1 Tax=Phreatobacter stygius TaxID=1940610 RepID=A0A4D7AXR8_9HYPH|nr:ATP-binding protein [Phreatobacter stygius]QCI63578.1 ATP-binding protein [Phreatobacter stygius]